MKLRKVLPLLTILYLATTHVAAQLAHDGAKLVVSPDWSKQQLLANYGKLPLVFELKQDRSYGPAQFISHGSDYTLYLTAQEAVLVLRTSALVQSKPGAFNFPSEAPGTVALHIKLLGANPKARGYTLAQMPGKVNYFFGSDLKNWRTNVPTFAKVEYRNVYRGVDVIYRGNRRQLEYDFVVRPGAELEQIGLQFQGAEMMEVETGGDLVLHLGGRIVRQPRPVVYQDVGGTRRKISAEYVMKGKDRVHFGIAAYDRSRPLVIDPRLSYSTYLGGSDEDRGLGIAVDSEGNAYVTGGTASINFPTRSSALQTSFLGGGEDTFVSKLNAAGSALIYSTYVGGTGNDFGLGIAIDSARNAYVTGFTGSTDFPVTSGAFQTIFGGDSDGFVYKLNAAGSALVYSTYVGGNGSDEGRGIAVDVAGNAYVVGQNLFGNFPTTPGALQTSFGGVEDAVVSKLNESGSALVYSTYLGGSSDEVGFGIAVDAGSAYVTGYTSSTDFPTNSPGLQDFGGDFDAFVSKLNESGSALIYSTFLGGSFGDVGFGIAVDNAGNTYVTGLTTSTDFPTTSGTLQVSPGGGTNGFVSKLNSKGSTLVYSTYLGGNVYDEGNSIAVDSEGNAYVTGITFSADFPTTPGAFQTSFAGFGDAFMSKLNATGSALVYSTYLGGRSGEEEEGRGIALDPVGNVYVAGLTTSPDFPTTPGALQANFGGGPSDAFVSKFSFGIGPPTKIGQCKKDGWKIFSIPRKFKNQGDCVSFVNRVK